MTMAFLNGEYLPLTEARISPMDRGFLFGDGIYEVIPSYGGRMVGFGPHIDRMRGGLEAIHIGLERDDAWWREICERLMRENGGGNSTAYADVKTFP